MKKSILRILNVTLLLAVTSARSQNVWTQHNDQARTGWYPYETSLTTNSVNKNTFGIYFDHTTDDKIVGQPLVVMNVNIPNKGIKNVVFVTTLNNSIYAYDADVNADAYWQQNYSNKISASGPDCVNCRPAKNTDIHPSLCGGSYGDFSGNMGIVGTPVIDTASYTMYFVTKIVNPNDGMIDNHNYSSGKNDEYSYSTTGFHQYLHAIDIRTGNEKENSPVEIQASSTGTGDGQTSPGIITFNPRTQFNRAGLVLSNGMIYIAFAAHCDFNPSHGWIIRYRANTLEYLNAYNATPNDGRGGIWMSGTAPAVDEAGNIYFTTGNSLNENRSSTNYHTYNTTYANDPANRGEGVIKLAADLTLSSYFTPYNYIALNEADKDFPIQVMLLPNTNLAMTGCKDGNLYVMDKGNMGGFSTTGNYNKQTIANGGTMHSSFAYFGGTSAFAYQLSENTRLRAYAVTPNGLGNSVTNSAIAGPSGGTGGFLSVSSNGTDQSTGILWAYRPINGCNANNNNCHAILHAIKATDINNELWNSDMVAADNISIFNKFSCPTIALGKVYVAANSNKLLCYGIKNNTTCINNIAAGKPVTALTTASGSATNITDVNFSTSWRATDHDVDSVIIDLGGVYDICRLAVTWENNRYAKDFDLKISDDAVNWTTIQSIRDNNLSYTEYNSAATGRFVNLVCVTRGTNNSYGISEFQVFGSAANACSNPSGLTASSVSTSSEHLSWSSIAGSARYIIRYRSNLSASWITKTSTLNSIDLTALTCGSLYYYTVQASCGTTLSAVTPGSFTTANCSSNTCDIFPVRYYSVDLGDIGIAGSSCKDQNIYNLSGSGSDIGGSSDQFQFTYTNNDIADYEAMGLIKQQDQVTTRNKLGIMARDSLTNTSRFAYIASVNNGGNIIFEYRQQPGGPTTSIVAGSHPLPCWMKISKLGTTYRGYISADKINWTLIGNSVDLHFGNDPSNISNYGMAITSGSNSNLSTGKVQDFSLIVSAPLPVMLLDFTAKNINDEHILVSWATSMEHLSDQFEIQKSSDNISFDSFETVKAAEESETPRYYYVNDMHPVQGINYYRLKEKDKDGKVYYSPVVSVGFNAVPGIEVYPNPVNDFTNLNSRKDPIVQVNVYDATGKLHIDEHPANGQTSVHLNMSGLNRGIYILRIKTTSAVYQQKLIKQ